MKKNDELSFFNEFLKKENPDDLGSKSRKTVVTYTRVSSKEQADSNSSLERQTKEVEKFAEEKGYIITASYGQTYESAKGDLSRKEFKKLLDDLKKTKVKPFAIVVNFINRFSRTGGQAISILTELLNQNVHVIESSSGKDTTTTEGYMYILQKLVDAKKENNTRLETTIPGMRLYLEKGYWLGKVPFGYDQYGPRVKDREKLFECQKITINKQGKVLKKAFYWKIYDKFSNSLIIEKMKQEGVKISKQKLSQIWHKPFYCGICTNKMLKKAVPGNWEAMISIQEFKLLQSMLNKFEPGIKINLNLEKKPLTGTLRCGVCQRPLTGYEIKKKGLWYYKCECCKGVSMNANTTVRSKNSGAHDLFTELLNSYKLNEQMLPLIELQIKKLYGYYNHEMIERQTKANITLNDWQRKSNALEGRFAIGTTNEAQYAIGKAMLEKEMEELQVILNNLPDQVSNLEELVRSSVENLQNLANLWHFAGIEGKQRIQKMLFPNGILYSKEKHLYLTKRTNSFLFITKSESDRCEEKKSGTFHQSDEKSHLVAGAGLEPATFGL